MLFIRKYVQHALVILCVALDVLKNHQFVITDGNAASKNTSYSLDQEILDSCKEVLVADDWNPYPDGKRKRCAEVLIYPKVEPCYIHKVISHNQMIADIARVITGKTSVVDLAFYFSQE